MTSTSGRPTPSTKTANAIPDGIAAAVTTDGSDSGAKASGEALPTAKGPLLDPGLPVYVSRACSVGGKPIHSGTYRANFFTAAELHAIPPGIARNLPTA